MVAGWSPEANRISDTMMHSRATIVKNEICSLYYRGKVNLDSRVSSIL